MQTTILFVEDNRDLRKNAALVLELWSDASWVWVAAGVVGVVIELVLLPLKAAWASLAYVDLRVRTEGLDLELELDEVFGAA